VKRTGRDARVAPSSVLYDPTLTVGLPPEVSAASGMNAVVHPVEALYAPDANPVASLFAEEALRLLSAILRRVVRQPGDLPLALTRWPGPISPAARST
jgi:maleylacetate reductase